MTDLITIDGATYDVPIISIDITPEPLEKYAERTVDGTLHVERIGVFDKYSVVFGRNNANSVDYASLYAVLGSATVFHTVVLPTPTGTVTMTAYFAGVAHTLYKVKGSNKYYKGLKANIIPRDPTRTP
jgi:hypothetical protein